MDFATDTSVGEIASKHPLSTRVFHRHGIDFCCGGGVSLNEACAKRGLQGEGVLSEITDELSKSVDKGKRWDEAPLGELIDFILIEFHAPLKIELPRLREMAMKVHAVHGPKDPENLAELSKLVQWLATELDQHLLKEEEILFPMVKAGQGGTANGPVTVMEDEHVHAGEALRRLRELTNNYTVPAEACNTWTALWHGLEALEESLHQHIHLENNILFPRALAGK
ncbi:MAG: regulator of cell morphogenesis and NO signaling [Planctomycetota bacterium]|jgi:regulator of cell morphogenesis and NO signaling